jgi:RecA-family ATPase
MSADTVRADDAARVARIAEEAAAIEQSTLGAIMLGGLPTLRTVQEIVEADDFVSEDHRAIFNAACNLQDGGSAVDAPLVVAELQRAGKLAAAGGAEYVAKLVAEVPTAAHAAHYARVLRERADVRRLRLAALTVANEAAQPGAEAPTLRDRLEQLLPKAPPVRWKLPAAIDPAEFASARLTPDCIVENLLFADVAVLIAPGGTGKTTLLLFEAIHVVLGVTLYGLTIHTPGPVLIITGEDTRQMLIARLRLMVEAMNLDAAAIATVMRDVGISDVSDRGLKLTTVIDDVVLPSPLVDIIIAEARTLQPVLVVIDPAISFGVGEARVNDAEQGLIEAARRIRGELRCCVRYVHHSGKVNARDKVLDQYAGRGGSAFADGARMVAVLQPVTPDEWRKATGAPMLAGENGMVLARPKLSYCPPQPDILISRKGYAFAYMTRAESDPAGKLQANCDQILRAIVADLDKGNRHTQRSLEALNVMPRSDLRDAVSTLIARGLVEHADIPERRKGGPQTYLRPTSRAE